jgi:hypothetical protein
MSDNIDQFGNIRTTGTGLSIAQAISALAGNPKAEAEASNFRNVSEANQIKLEDARRAADRDKALDPHRQGLASLFKPTESWDPNGGEEVGPDGLRPKMIKKRAAFHWNGNRFEFDQDAVSQLVEHGVALYGPDFAKNWHPFLTNAAPSYSDLHPTAQPSATIGGRGGIAGAIATNSGQRAVAEDEALAGAKLKAKVEAAVGSTTNADGTVEYGPDSPVVQRKKMGLPKITDDEAGRKLYESLPINAEYVDPTGKIKKKTKKP